MTVISRYMPIDMLVLNMSEFNVILGMNWLNCYGVVIYCSSFLLRFALPREISFSLSLKFRDLVGCLQRSCRVDLTLQLYLLRKRVVWIISRLCGSLLMCF